MRGVSLLLGKQRGLGCRGNSFVTFKKPFYLLDQNHILAQNSRPKCTLPVPSSMT